MSAKLELARLGAAGLTLAGMTFLGGEKPNDAGASQTPRTPQGIELMHNPNTLQIPAQTMEFDYKGIHYKWSEENDYYDSSGKQNGRIIIEKDGILQEDFILTMNSIYPDTPNSGYVIFGMAVDIETGRGYLLTGTKGSRNDASIFLEEIMHIDTPTIYTADERKLYTNNMLSGGTIAISGIPTFNFYELRKDSLGKYLIMGTQSAKYSSQNGFSKVYLDTTNGNLLLPFEKASLPDGFMSPRLFMSIVVEKAPQP